MMNNSVSVSEPQRESETGRRAPKVNKACVPCRARKVKCDGAVHGLPCSSCISRQCSEGCVLPVRKGRRRKRTSALPAPSHTTVASAISNGSQLVRSNQDSQSRQPSASDSRDCQSPRQAEGDLLYLNILNDAVKETTQFSKQPATSANTQASSTSEDTLTPRNCLWTRLPQLDDIDNEYLVKKGVFDLPPPEQLDVLIKSYFDHVHPFTPLINTADFIRSYQSGDCSLFLLHVILAPASIHAPADVLTACGFLNRSVAQESFFSKAKLLYDLGAENDPLLQLQGCIILSMVILDHATDRDFSYWLHNAIHLATKLDLRNTCIRQDKPRKLVKLYRRIWWALHFLDIFHVCVNPRRTPLLPDTPEIKPRSEDDSEEEDVSEIPSSLLPAVTPPQRALPVIHCELSRIFRNCVSTVTNKIQQDPRQMLHPLDVWRKSLAAKMHVGEHISTDVYYLSVQAMSYRFECILCRTIRRRWKQSQREEWSEWARQRLRSAILELDTIAMRVLATGTLHDFPTPFITTMTALLALHIESALDPVETDLVHSMARLSISQTMLVLSQGKDIPVLTRALPIFEEIIAKNNLYLGPLNTVSQVNARSPSQGADINNSTLDTQFDMASSHLERRGNSPSFGVDFLGFDFLDDWQYGQLDYLGQNMT